MYCDVEAAAAVEGLGDKGRHDGPVSTSKNSACLVQEHGEGVGNRGLLNVKRIVIALVLGGWLGSGVASHNQTTDQVGGFWCNKIAAGCAS